MAKRRHEHDVFRLRDCGENHDTVGRWAAPRPPPSVRAYHTVPTVVLRWTLSHRGLLCHMLIMTACNDVFDNNR